METDSMIKTNKFCALLVQHCLSLLEMLLCVGSCFLVCHVEDKNTYTKHAHTKCKIAVNLK